MTRATVLMLLFLAGCPGRNSSLNKASTTLPEDPSPSAAAQPGTKTEAEPAPDDSGRPKPTADFYSPAQPHAAKQPKQGTTGASSPAHGGSANDDPKISRSAGQPGGVVVLWPRVIPTDITDMNRRMIQEVQTHLRVVVQRAAPGKPVDVRPEPERVCRRSGCEATAVSVLFHRTGDGCAVVALVTPPGPVETTLVPWAGGVELSRTQIAFREAPESYLSIKDLARCSELEQVMQQNDAAVEAAIRAALP